MKNLTGKTVLITGGASGLGKAMVERFAEEGSNVVIADLSEEAGTTIAAAAGGAFVKTNVTDPASVEAAVAFAVERFGRLDVMVNNAGIESLQAPMHECTIDNWLKVIDVNLSGVFYGMKYAIAQFVRQGGGGNVVNTSSVAGLVGFQNIPPYSASKAAVSNLTREGAIEYGPMNIRVNAVAPTAVMTELNQRIVDTSDDPAAMLHYIQTLNPLAGMPVPEDVAAAVAFLASDDARFISGAILPVDGGYTAR
ncbi:SDR family NAD(P)-dependent oxidoreductase [Sphingomonas sp.]|uniref:SDR family NAD(P)-dependent oxidoreductase n=1 Tax=Sphingomonas sp. TaxID=28214 RepID=UPI003D6D4CFF